jgi:ribonuclease P protein component
VLRLKSRAQFQAVLAGPTVARTTHFALHQLDLKPATPVVTPEIPADLNPDAMALSTGRRSGLLVDPAAVLLPERSANTLFPDPSMAWLGAMIPKRWAKRAVTRNAIKRQVYAVTAGHVPPLPCAAYVLRLRAAFDRKQFVSASSEQLKQAVRTELQLLLARAGEAPGSVGGRRGAADGPRGRIGASP